jgi:putative ABC transport system permease protein
MVSFLYPETLMPPVRRSPLAALLDVFAQDSRHLVRSLRRSPGFAAVVVLTLALGIGATTAVLSVVDHVVLRSLPFRDAGQLMMMLERDDGGAFRVPSYPTVEDWRRDPGVQQAFAGVTFVRGDGVQLTDGDRAENVTSAFPGADFFPLLGSRPLLGRTLLADDQRDGAPPVVVLSYAFWMKRFGGDRAILGRRISLDSLPTTVVGVMPAGVVYPVFAQIWQPLASYRHRDVLTRRGVHVDSRTLARLRPGVDSARAVALMRTVSARLASAYPEEQAHWNAAMFPIRKEIIGDVTPMLLTLGAAAIAILLLACSNVANLLLARMSSRTRELAVRSALGASRMRLIGQLLTESALLALAGGVVGMGLAGAAIATARRVLPGKLARIDELSVDGRVLAVAALASLLTALVCGVWPAIRATRAASGETLRTGAMGAGGVRADARLRRALVTVQFALALVLLVGAGLLLQSFRRVVAVPLGFDPHGLVTARVSPSGEKYGTPDQARALYDRLLESIRSVPGVSDVALIQHFPLSGAAMTTPIDVGGRPSGDTSSNQVYYRTVSDGYLSAMKMSMAAGRWFTAADMRSPGGAFVVNATLAKRYWPGQSAIGKRMTVHRASQVRADFGQPLAGIVVGVVADVHNVSQDAAPDPEVYVPFTLEVWPWVTLVARTHGDAATRDALRRAVRAVEPALMAGNAASTDGFTPATDLLAGGLEPRRFMMGLIGIFAGCALALAAIGMYGVVAYGVTQRTRELGVRKALGATDAMIAALVVRESMTLAGAGVVIGCAGAWGGARLIRALLFDTGPADPGPYLATIGLLVAVALIATYLPARRAVRLDPTIAMRGD